MADTKAIGKLVIQLNKQIESGVELFKYYKEKSKDFQKRQKNMMNNEESKKIFANLKQKYDEEMKVIMAKRKVTSTLKYVLPNHVREKQMKKTDNAERALKKNYENKLIKHKEAHEKLSDMYLVNSEKMFLNEKEKIRVEKKRILSKILEIGREIKSLMDIKDFKKFIDRLNKRKYEVLDGKKISFVTLMKHLSSGEISEQVAKTTKQIDELMTTGNVVNRKKKMEIGILKKEIENLLIDYDTTMKSLKKLAAIKFPNKKEITNEDIGSLLTEKYSKKNSPEYRKELNKLASDLKKYNLKVKTKMQKLKKLQESL
jgi:hypothetical protein